MPPPPESGMAFRLEVTGLVADVGRHIPSIDQASLFAKNNIMTILIQDVANTLAGYQKEILPSSWSPRPSLNFAGLPIPKVCPVFGHGVNRLGDLDL